MRRADPGRSASSFLGSVFAGFGERKEEVSGVSAGLGLESSEFFGQVVGYEGLAGCDSVDAAYFLNGFFQKIL